MKGRYWLGMPALTAVVGLWTMPAMAGPLHGVPVDLRASAGEISDIEQAAHGRRDCWRQHGRWRCPRRGPGYYDPYAYYDPFYYGPGVGFFFGHHGHGFHGHGFHGHVGGHGGHGGHGGGGHH